jgi:hypothetical protein
MKVNFQCDPGRYFHRVSLITKHKTGYAANQGGKQSKKPNLTLPHAQLRAFILLMLKYNIIRGKSAEQKT